MVEVERPTIRLFANLASPFTLSSPYLMHSFLVFFFIASLFAMCMHSKNTVCEDGMLHFCYVNLSRCHSLLMLRGCRHQLLELLVVP